MSNSLITRAYTKNVPPKYQHVLVLLCDMANDSGICWPSVNRIAWKLGTSRSTVLRAIKGLEEMGVLEVKRRHRRHNIYAINLNAAPDKEPYKRTEDDSVSDMIRSLGINLEPNNILGSNLTPYGSQNDTQLGSNLTPQPKGEPSDTPQGGKRSRRKPEVPIPDDFTLTPERLAYALEKGLDRQRAEIQFERMRNWAKGKDERKRDWDATWRNWVLGEIERRGTGPARRQADKNGGLVLG